MKRSLYQSRCHGVDANFIADKFLRLASRQVADEALCGSIKHGAIAAASPGRHRAGVDNKAAASSFQMPMRSDTRLPHRSCIQIDHAVEMIG